MTDQFKELHPELHKGERQSNRPAEDATSDNHFTSLSSEVKQWIELDAFSLQWLKETLTQLGIDESFKAEALTGDASSRRYVRIHLHKRTFILCLSEDYFSNQRFREVSAQLQTVGIMAPLVFAYNETPGLMLLSDLGSTSLSDLYAMNSKHLPMAVIHRALNDLSRLAVMPEDAFPSLGNYDQTLLDRDFGLFTDWALSHWLELEVDVEQQQTLQNMAEVLKDAFSLQPQVWVHRDFHCRNLMVTDDDIAMIDFQDMVRGPVTYDLASIVNDAYWLMSPEQQDQLIEDYYKVLRSIAFLDDSVSLQTFKAWHAFTALQRLLKVIGIFCRLSLRDGKHTYMTDLVVVLENTTRQILHLTDILDDMDKASSSDAGFMILKPLLVKSKSFIALWEALLHPQLSQKLDQFLSDKRC